MPTQTKERKKRHFTEAQKQRKHAYHKQYIQREDVKQRRKANSQTENFKWRVFVNCAKRKGLLVEITRKWWKWLLTQPCYLCGKDATGIDRVDNMKGYLIDNCQPCCKRCNFYKRDHPLPLFFQDIFDLYCNNLPLMKFLHQPL